MRRNRSTHDPTDPMERDRHRPGGSGPPVKTTCSAKAAGVYLSKIAACAPSPALTRGVRATGGVMGWPTPSPMSSSSVSRPAIACAKSASTTMPARTDAATPSTDSRSVGWTASTTRPAPMATSVRTLCGTVVPANARRSPCRARATSTRRAPNAYASDATHSASATAARPVILRQAGQSATRLWPRPRSATSPTTTATGSPTTSCASVRSARAQSMWTPVS